MNPTVLATVNQKGGVAKTTSCINIGAAMAREGKKVLLVDTDPQGSMTISLGNQQPDQLVPTIADLMTKVMNDVPIAPGEGILHHPEGIDLLPANIALAGTEVSLVNAMSRETILKQVLARNRQSFSWNADDQRAGSRRPDHHPGSGAVSVHQRCRAVAGNCCPCEAEHQSQAED